MASRLVTNRDDMAGDICLKKLIRHKSFLEEIVDPDSGLLDELLSSETLTRKEFRHITRKDPYDERNAKLLECITDQGKCDSFVTALRNTKQEHVVNYLMADGACRSIFGLNWPLKEFQMKTIDANQKFLVDLINTSELVGLLYSKDIISRRQRNAILSEANPDKRNELFLEILRRRSQSDFKEAIASLIESKQPHVAEILDKGGVAVQVHVTTDAAAETEREIAERCMRIIGDRPVEECMRIVERMQFKIISAKVGNSIILYVLCQTPQQWEQLQASVKDGTLRAPVGWLFNEVMHGEREITILGIRIEDKEFSRIEQCVEAGRFATFDSKSLNAEESEGAAMSLTTQFAEKFKLNKTSELWQIYVECGKSLITIMVPENCTTKELFDAVKRHLHVPNVHDLDLMHVHTQLLRSSTERLYDYNITSRSTLTAFARLAGGGRPSDVWAWRGEGKDEDEEESD